jgi:hypothetical protein
MYIQYSIQLKSINYDQSKKDIIPYSSYTRST